MKNNRRKIALIIVLALALTVAIPVLADQTKITGTYQDIEIDVKLPGATDTAIVNPYSLPVEIKTDGSETVARASLGKLNTSGQIASMPLVGCNLGEFDLTVGATVSGEAKGDFILSATAPASGTITKTGQVFFQLKNAAYNIGLDSNPATSVNGFNGANVMHVYSGWTKATAPTTGDVVVGATPASTPTANLVTITKAVADPADATKLIPDTNSYFVARLCGNIVKAPTDAWKTRDGFVATIIWNIEPVTT